MFLIINHRDLCVAMDFSHEAESIFSSKRLRNSLFDEVQLLVANFSTPLGGLFARLLVS